MGKTLCITQFHDAPVDPKQREPLRRFLEAIAEAIVHWIRQEHKRILVVCKHGQNRSATVCCLVMMKMVRGCSNFDKAASRLRQIAQHAHSKGAVVPTKFLCTGGGQYFEMLFKEEGTPRKKRRRIESTDRENRSLARNVPYTLELTSDNVDEGGLWIGNLSGLVETDEDFDIMINLSGKEKALADHEEEWKNCMCPTRIRSLLKTNE